MPESFHAALDRALAGGDAALDPWVAADARSRAGLAVHRNTAARARTDALAALFPTVARLVGDDWFREAARRHAAVSPPTGPAPDAWGHAFPDWLAGFPPGRDLPYLAPAARIDLAWSRAHGAADAPALDPAAVRGVSPQRLAAARARPHPSLQLFWFDWPVVSIWLANRTPDPPPPIDWRPLGEGLALVRPGGEVVPMRLSRADWAFLDAARKGRTLGGCAAAAFAAEPGLDLAALFARLLAAGVFTRLDPSEPDRP